MGYRVHFPHLFKWQSDVFNAVVHDRSVNCFVVKARRQCGKSVVAIATCLYFAFKNPGSIGVICEPTLKQSRRVWKQILRACGGERSEIIKSANQTLLTIEFSNGSELNLCSAEQGDALRGQTVKYSVLVIDEASFIDKEVFEILQPLTDVTNSPTLLISTPLFRQGEFYERFTRGSNGDKHIRVFDWSKYDTSALLSPEKLEYYRQTMSALKFKSEYLGEFIDAGSFVFGDISKCYGELSRKPALYAGIDWSAGGEDSDYTVLTFLDEDARVCDIKFWQEVDSVDLVDAIAMELRDRPSLKTCQVELNSMGKVYRDLLKRKVRSGLIRDFTTTNESKRRVVEQLITAFQQGQITVPQDRELVKELQVYQVESTPTGLVTYNAPSGAHDDAVISLALAYDLARKRDGQGKVRVTLV